MPEIIRECPSYPGYSVSRFGSVFSHWRRVYGIKGRGSHVVMDKKFLRKLKTQVGTGGYRIVSLTVNGRETCAFVHCMLLDAFVGPCPEGYQCRHLDGDNTNNSLSNLAWGTPQENADDRQRHGTYDRGEAHYNSLLTDAAVIDIRTSPKFYGYRRALAAKYKVSVNTIATVLYGRSWRHIDDLSGVSVQPS